VRAILIEKAASLFGDVGAAPVPGLTSAEARRRLADQRQRGGSGGDVLGAHGIAVHGGGIERRLREERGERSGKGAPVRGLDGDALGRLRGDVLDDAGERLFDREGRGHGVTLSSRRLSPGLLSAEVQHILYLMRFVKHLRSFRCVTSCVIRYQADTQEAALHVRFWRPFQRSTSSLAVRQGLPQAPASILWRPGIWQ
jgi:hypothetical protein